MVSYLFYYQLALFVLMWLFVMLHVTWSKPGLPTPPVPAQPKRPRSKAPKAFEGLTKKPHCALCERRALIMASATPFWCCTTQKYLAAKIAIISMAYGIVTPATPLVY